MPYYSVQYVDKVRMFYENYHFTLCQFMIASLKDYMSHMSKLILVILHSSFALGFA